MLKINRILVYLGLNNNQIGARGVRDLTNALVGYNTNLRELDLASNKSLDDSSVDFLVRMLKHNRTLKVLDVHGCGLSTTGKIELENAVQHNTGFELVTKRTTTGAKIGSSWVGAIFARQK
jgi:Ran GTPase-activating protein (RanGAP) involved in mRNA processing and transport